MDLFFFLLNFILMIYLPLQLLVSQFLSSVLNLCSTLRKQEHAKLQDCSSRVRDERPSYPF